MTNAAFKQTALRYTVNGAKDLKQVAIVVNQHSSGLPGHLLAHNSIYTRWLHRQRWQLQVLHIFLFKGRMRRRKHGKASASWLLGSSIQILIFFRTVIPLILPTCLKVIAFSLFLALSFPTQNLPFWTELDWTGLENWCSGKPVRYILVYW